MKELDLFKSTRPKDRERWLKLAKYIMYCHENRLYIEVPEAALASGYSEKSLKKKLIQIALLNSQGYSITERGTFADKLEEDRLQK